MCITPFSIRFFLHASAPASTPKVIVWIQKPLCILMALSIPCYWFDLMAGFSFSSRGHFCWGPPFFCSTSTALSNLDAAYYILLFSLWNLKVFFLLCPRNLLLSWVMSLSITVCSTLDFRRLATSGNTATKLADNELGSTGYWYPSTPFQYGKGMLSPSWKSFQQCQTGMRHHERVHQF